jgi:hypothetical protein
MVLGDGIMAIGPKRSHRRPGARVYCGFNTKLYWPQFGFCKKIANTSSDVQSGTEKLLPCYDETSGLPKALALFDPHKFNAGMFM